MPNKTSSQNIELICDCTGTTRDKIKQLIKNGANDMDKISSATGAGTGCGSCDVLIMELLENDKVKNVSSTLNSLNKT